MIKVSFIEVGCVSRNLLFTLKNHARVSESNTDALLEGYLREALLKVGEYNDVSLIPCTMQVEASECEGEVRLYQTIDEVTEVTSNGMPIDYTINGNTIKVDADDVKVVYTTKVDEGNLAMYLPSVLAYATARYDGVTGLELFKTIAR